MNKAFKVIWSEARNAYVVVSEMAKSHGTKSCSTKKLLAMLIAAGIMTCASAAPVMAEHLAKDDYKIVAGKDAEANIGCVAIGNEAKAYDGDTVAIGQKASASVQGSIAIGNTATASELEAIAIGRGAVASGEDSIAIGGATKATNKYSVAIGNDISFTAYQATAVGQQAYASGNFATAIGTMTNVDADWNKTHDDIRKAGLQSTAIGVSAGSWGDHSTAVGDFSKAEGKKATALGSSSKAKGENATALGSSSKAEGKNATALGSSSKAEGENATALGNFSKAEGSYATALGKSSNAKGYLATAIGSNSQANADRSTALGYYSQANVDYGTALGFNSKVTASHGVAIGDSSVADRESGVVGAFAPEGEDSLTRTWKATGGAVSVGSDKLTRQITNVAAGSEDTDAVNVAQLKAATEGVENQVVSNTNRINQLGSRVNKVGAGAAALAALHPMDFDPDDKWSFAAGMGNYAGQNAAAIGAFYRPDEKVMFSVGGTVGNGENMVNAGISFALDRTNHVSNSRTALAREVIDLRGQLAVMGAKMAKMEKAFGMLDETKTKLFPDIPANHWAYEYIAKLAGNGYIKGYPDGNFGGDRLMTRYEFAAMLYRAIENGAALEEKIIKEFEPELGRIRVDRISGEDGDRDKIERVRVNDTKGERDHYGNKIAKAEAKAK